jgi:hypothetical protein
MARTARPAPTAAIGRPVAAAARLSDAEAAVVDPEAELSACVDARAVELLGAEVLAASEASEADEDEDEPPSL